MWDRLVPSMRLEKATHQAFKRCFGGGGRLEQQLLAGLTAPRPLQSSTSLNTTPPVEGRDSVHPRSIV